MSKRQETPEWMESFFEAVYPEYTNLAVSIARGEEQILRDATRVIQELRAENARLKEALRGCVEIGETLGCTDPGCQHLSCAMLKKAREVLGDA